MGEESRKHHDDSSEIYGSKHHDIGSGKPSLKILVPNFVAGMLIGKGGSNINVLKSAFSASIQVSASREFYPGTEDRIVVISAETQHIIQFINYVIEDILRQQDSEGNTNLRREVKIVVTNVVAGLLIGKGGSFMKEIQGKSGAWINISKREEGLGERILVINGSIQQCVLACRLAIQRMSEEQGKISDSMSRHNSLNSFIPVTVSAPLLNDSHGNTQNVLHNGLAIMPTFAVDGMGSSHDILGYVPKSKAKAKFMVEMEIPDHLVGSILGKQGRTIYELSCGSGAQLQFSPKNKFVPDTTNRILTITGGMNQVQHAYKLVDEIIAQEGHELVGNLMLS